MHVSISSTIDAPICRSDNSIRISKIFPLLASLKEEPNLYSCKIHFFESFDSYRVFGRIQQKGTDNLKHKIFFSNGNCSIILFETDGNEHSELLSLVTNEFKVEDGVRQI